jgi:hypothetical protein
MLDGEFVFALDPRVRPPMIWQAARGSGLRSGVLELYAREPTKH